MSTLKNSSEKPFVSVVVAVKNGAATLQRCLDSFVSQTFVQKEIIIMDGGSDDGTVDIIRSHTETIAYWESKSDRGIAHAWNKALDHTTGEWIIFLGADDYFYNSDVLETFSSKITSRSRQDVRIVYGQVNLLFPSGEVYGIQGWEWDAIRSVFFSEKMMIPHQACFHHHTVFQERVFFDEEYKITADYELLLRILKNEDPLFLPDFIVTTMSFGGVSSQISTLLAMQDECNRALVKNGFAPKGFKRIGNIFVYRLLGFVLKYAGENAAKVMLDAIRVMIGRRPVWNRK